MAEMTPRERVIAALNHQEPDRIPVDIGGGNSTTIVEEGYENLKQYLGIEKDIKYQAYVLRLCRLDEEAMAALKVDVRPISIGAPERWSPPPMPDGFFKDIWGVTWKKIPYGEEGYYWEMVGHPLADATIEDLETYPWPDVDDPGFYANLEEEIRTLHEDTDYAIMADGAFKGFWETAYFMRGFEKMLMDLVLNPEFVKAFMAKLLEINKKATGRFLDIVGPYIHVFRAGDDMATQQGLTMSKEMFRELLAPYYRDYFEFVKTKTEAKQFFHSCGNVTELVDDLVDIGVEVLNPVQVSAMGDTAELKTRFGEKISFWGAMDTQRILPKGSVEDVENEVKRLARTLGPGGGFVLASVHNIQSDVPPENIVAMADSARKYGTYPISS